MRDLKLNVEYDPDANAGYVRLNDGEAWEGEEVAPGLIVHFDKSNKVVALEFLPASLLLDVVRRADTNEAA